MSDTVHTNVWLLLISIQSEKAGAVCVKFHAISPLSGSIDSRKFNNVIVHSGRKLSISCKLQVYKSSSGQQMAWNENPSEGAKRLAIRTGCGSQFQLDSEKFVACLRKLPVEAIVDAAAEESFADFVWSPVVDGIFLPEPPSRETHFGWHV